VADRSRMVGPSVSGAVEVPSYDAHDASGRISADGYPALPHVPATGSGQQGPASLDQTLGQAVPGHGAVQGTPDFLARIKGAVSSAAPRDEEAKGAYPALWWALNQRTGSDGKPCLGGTLSVSSDGGQYVVCLTLRQIEAQTFIRLESLLELYQAIEDALADPQTIWRAWKPLPGQKSKR